ncbi:YqeB family protein [Embleya scabrispora]|uniref:YqeB family protein n=1 Tax=Embleya scabrispora TaxID=159449 RepID=UPI00131A34BB|nr:hypothetical protein [Embleya scabrispora]MYS85524.1 hypothetical protein [Streptomyces sp. SID5474]
MNNTTENERAVTVRMPSVWLWLIGVGTTLLGVGAGFAIAPFVDWSIDLVGSAPGPLRLAARLPTRWAVPTTTVLGAVLGAWMVVDARRESPVVTVAEDHLTIHRNGSGLHVGRDRIHAVFTDGRDLVALDPSETELARVPATDLPVPHLRDAFAGFDYPWRGTTDPREAEFSTWVDGTPDLDEAAHTLLRTRKRALTDKRAGAAEEALDELRGLGVAVRDRKGAQQYRPRRPHPRAFDSPVER